MAAKTLVLVLVALIFEVHTQNCNGGNFPTLSLSSLELSPNIQVESILGCQPMRGSSNGYATSSLPRTCAPNTQAVEACSSISDGSTLPCSHNTLPYGPCGFEVESRSSNLRGVLFPVPVPTLIESPCASAPPSSTTSSPAIAIGPQCGLITPTASVNDFIGFPCEPLRADTNNIGYIVPNPSFSNSASTSAVASATSGTQTSNSNAMSSAVSQIPQAIHLGLSNAPAVNLGRAQGNVAISKASSLSVSGLTSPNNVVPCPCVLPGNCGCPNNLAITGPINAFSGNVQSCGCQNNLVNPATPAVSFGIPELFSPNHVGPCPSVPPSNCGSPNNLALTGPIHTFSGNGQNCGCQNNLLNTPAFNLHEIRRTFNAEPCQHPCPCQSMSTSTGNPNILGNSMQTLNIVDGPCNNLPTWSLSNPVRSPQSIGTEVCIPTIQTVSVPEHNTCACNAIHSNTGLFSSVVNPIASSLNELCDFLTTVAPLVDIVNPLEQNSCGYPDIVPITTSSIAVVDGCNCKPCHTAQPCSRPHSSQSSTCSVAETSSIASSVAVSESTGASTSIATVDSTSLTVDNSQFSLSSATTTSSTTETDTPLSTAAACSAVETCSPSTVAVTSAAAATTAETVSPSTAALSVASAATTVESCSPSTAAVTTAAAATAAETVTSSTGALGSASTSTAAETCCPSTAAVTSAAATTAETVGLTCASPSATAVSSASAVTTTDTINPSTSSVRSAAAATTSSSNTYPYPQSSGFCSFAGSVEPLVYELQIPACIPAQLQCSFGC